MNEPTAATQDALRRNIDDHFSGMQSLLQTLAREREALDSKDPAALEQIAAEKNRLVNALQTLSRQLHALPGGRPGAELESSIRHGGSALQQRWQQLLELTERCQRDNLANGALIDARQAQVKWALDHMLGIGNAAPTYGRAGVNREIGARLLVASA